MAVGVGSTRLNGEAFEELGQNGGVARVERVFSVRLICDAFCAFFWGVLDGACHMARDESGTRAVFFFHRFGELDRADARGDWSLACVRGLDLISDMREIVCDAGRFRGHDQKRNFGIGRMVRWMKEGSRYTASETFWGWVSQGDGVFCLVCRAHATVLVSGLGTACVFDEFHAVILRAARGVAIWVWWNCEFEPRI